VNMISRRAWIGRQARHEQFRLPLLLALLALLAPAGGHAADRLATASLEATDAAPAREAGRVTGLPVPRYVSLKASRANVRRGPGTDFPIDWVYTKRGVPLEVIAESNHWRRIRDHEGDGGWIWHTMLAGERTAVLEARPDGTPHALHETASGEAPVTAYAEAGVVAAVKACKGGWCRVEAQGRDGWIAQRALWGVYPGESFE
jgi:SH3-like domain-containing protein